MIAGLTETNSAPVQQAHGDPAHALVLPALLLRYQTTEAGLTSAQASARRQQTGPNALAADVTTPWWSVAWMQLRELVVLLLLLAAAVALLLGEWIDAAAIAIIVVLNTGLGVYQHFKTEHALDALKKLSAPLAKVIRDGVLQTIDARNVVPGDRIELEAGDHVPADARLLHAYGLQAQEAPLTGESMPVAKRVEILPAATSLGERRNMVHCGTVIATGKASALVVATGMRTELGRVARMLGSTPIALTPLQARFQQLGRTLVALCVLLVAVIAGLQLARGAGLWETFRLSISLAVAAVPEGLPAVLTITLALGAMRLARRRALVRRLSSVETLGSVTVVCSDKTGTLTRNEMTVREIFAGEGLYVVSGSGYSPEGTLARWSDPADLNGQTLNSAIVHQVPAATTSIALGPDLRQVLTVACWCNHAEVIPDPTGNDSWQVIGDPTEAALVVVGRKAGIGRESQNFRVAYEIPFDSERKLMTVVVQDEERSPTAFTKGAPEVLLEKCAYWLRHGKVQELTSADRNAILAANGAMAGRALRVLGVAYRPGVDPAERELVEHNLVFAGLLGMIDPPRLEAKAAVETCDRAGIRVVMITGDHAATARAIAAELGVACDEHAVVTGQRIDDWTDETLDRHLPRIAVFARVTAEHKLRIVNALRRQGEVVAMTGDGVNDAPAVKRADVGIAMGITGTDVTRQSASVVLMDDNFATIVQAVEEGRAIFENILKFVQYLLAGNAGKLLFMFVAILWGWPAPLLAIQLLWLNVVTDGLPALSLGAEPTGSRLMLHAPRSPHQPLLSVGLGVRILLHGGASAVAALLGFAAVYRNDDHNLAAAQLVAFCILGFGQLAYSFACRSSVQTVWQLGWSTNRALLVAVTLSAVLQLAVVLIPSLHVPFGIEAYPRPEQWLLIGVLSLLPTVLIEATKWLCNRRQETNGSL